MKPIKQYLNEAEQRGIVKNDAEIATKLGIARSAVSRWRAGERAPDDDQAIALAQLLNVPEGEMLAECAAARAKRPETRAAWERIARVRAGNHGDTAINLEEVIETAKEKNGISQNELANRIGMRRENLSSVLRKRRRLPAEAAIELAELTGFRAKEVWEAAKRWTSTAACIMLSIWILFISTTQNSYASSGAYVESNHLIQIIAFLKRLKSKANRLLSSLKRMLSNDLPEPFL